MLSFFCSCLQKWCLQAGVGMVYLANVLPSLTMKLTGPYWFHLVTYRQTACRVVATPRFFCSWRTSCKMHGTWFWCCLNVEGKKLARFCYILLLWRAWWIWGRHFRFPLPYIVTWSCPSSRFTSWQSQKNALCSWQLANKVLFHHHCVWNPPFRLTCWS